VSCGGDSLSYIEVSVGLEDLLGTLPRDWHQTPIREMELRRGQRGRRRMETSVVLRAVAIALIVGTHSGLWSLPGGAHVLLAVAGFNFARFQRRGRTRERLRSLGRIALPSFLWIGGAALLSARVAWPQALGVNAFAVQPGQPWQYWFIESLLWLLVGAIALISIPVVRRLEQARPMAVATGLLLTALAVRFEVFFPAADHHRLGRPVEVAWLFTFGWAAAVTAGLRQRLVIGVLGLMAVPGFFGSGVRESLVAGGMVLLLLVPTIPVPRLAVRPVALVASASLYIYLVHWQVYPVVFRNLGGLAALAASLIGGLVAWWAVESLMSRRSRVAD
jgi:peptidoglycan/LPS O-acetylase OafA/YrhL